MRNRCGAFALVEAVLAAAVLGVVLALLVPATANARRGGGLAQSLANVGLILQAQEAYTLDHNLMPMRGAQYSNGQLSGWDTWNFGGENCRENAFASMFDEPAYARPLNPYLYPDVGMPRPAAYLNLGSGASWTFNHGTPGPERHSLVLPIFRSPGDVSRLNGCTPAPGPMYNQFGTSYLLNMKWWGVQGLPSGFTARYDEGCARIRDLASADYVWVADKTADAFACEGTFQGEFGGERMSVVGFRDGRSEYVQIQGGGVLETPDYTFIPWNNFLAGGPSGSGFTAPWAIATETNTIKPRNRR